MAGPTLGHIDCPTCGTPKGMRITHDKNGDPFGYCEATCSQQMRVGGDKSRVARFLARFPWAAGTVTGTVPAKAAQAPAPVPAKAPAPAPAPAPVQQAKPEPEPDTKPAPKRNGWAEGLAWLGGDR